MIPLTDCSNNNSNSSSSSSSSDPSLRWMDRTIYFAYANSGNPNSNNQFQVQDVQDALTEIQQITNLGQGYFSYTMADPAVLNPIYQTGQASSEYISFILIWDDTDFNNFVVNTLGGNVPDENAITVINAAYKRKFYMIFKSSCFVSSASCNSITSNGLRAMVARQLSLLVGIPAITNCAKTPTDVMCSTTPSDAQWNDLNKTNWANEFNNALETVLNNPNFYNEYTTSGTISSSSSSTSSSTNTTVVPSVSLETPMRTKILDNTLIIR